MALENPPHTTALEDRYGDQSKPASIAWNNTIATLLAHRSVRSYLPRPLPEGTVETLVAAAQSAATSSNLNLWSVIAVADKATKTQLAISRATSDISRKHP